MIWTSSLEWRPSFGKGALLTSGQSLNLSTADIPESQARLYEIPTTLHKLLPMTLAVLMAEGRTMFQDFRPIRSLGRFCFTFAESISTALLARNTLRRRRRTLPIWTACRSIRFPLLGELLDCEPSRLMPGSTLRIGNSRLDNRVFGGEPIEAQAFYCPTTPKLCPCCG